MPDYCSCSPDDDCDWFTTATLPGRLGDVAEDYKKTLWHATSGFRLNCDSELLDLKNAVAGALGLFAPPTFGECGRKFTISALVYRTYQGSPHAATALALLPTFGHQGNEETLRIAPLRSIISTVHAGEVEGEYRWEFDIDLVWPSGGPPEGYVPDNHRYTPNELQIWEHWSRKLAGEILGEHGVWDLWPYQDVARVPSPARIDNVAMDTKDDTGDAVTDQIDQSGIWTESEVLHYGFSTWRPLSAHSPRGSTGPSSIDGGTPPSSDAEGSESDFGPGSFGDSPTPDVLQRRSMGARGPFDPTLLIMTSPQSARLLYRPLCAHVYPTASYQWYVTPYV